MEPGRVGLAVPLPVKLPMTAVLTRSAIKVNWLAAVLLFWNSTEVYLSLCDIRPVGVEVVEQNLPDGRVCLRRRRASGGHSDGES